MTFLCFHIEENLLLYNLNAMDTIYTYNTQQDGHPLTLMTLMNLVTIFSLISGLCSCKIIDLTLYLPNKKKSLQVLIYPTYITLSLNLSNIMTQLMTLKTLIS